MNSLFDLKNKVVVITGATGALASTAAFSLAEAGAKIALLTRNVSNLTDTINHIEKHGGIAKGFKADILSETSLQEVCAEILAWNGKIDVLLNIAGGNLPGATIAIDQTIFDMKMEDFNKVTELNLNGTVLPSLVFGKVMSEQKTGSIINYSSMATQRIITRVAGYSAAKSAMENFTKWMAVEMAIKFGDGIRVNAISPGFFIGKQNRSLLLNDDGTYTDRGNAIIRNTPMGRFGEAEELNGAIHFLSSNASKFVTGVVLPVDGGFNAFSGV